MEAIDSAFAIIYLRKCISKNNWFGTIFVSVWTLMHSNVVSIPFSSLYNVRMFSGAVIKYNP